MTAGTPPKVAVVLIGRNEGARLVAALAAVPAGVGPVVYVDSGSTDDSVATAEIAGARVVRLDSARPFTAARARNEGFAALEAEAPVYVQFVDGDCSLDPNWIDTARAFMETCPKAAVACGRRRERFPNSSLWNWLCNEEWDTPPGLAKACGGDALVRALAFAKAGGFNSSLIAGEEPELCVRLRAAGWEVWRLDAEMAKHDADMHHFSQWWKRMRRGGHAFAEGASLHGRPPERHFVRETVSALAWGLALPVGIALGVFLLGPSALLLLLAWPLQVLRLAPRLGITRAIFLTLGKLPEAMGVAEFWLRRLRARPAALIEYK